MGISYGISHRSVQIHHKSIYTRRKANQLSCDLQTSAIMAPIVKIHKNFISNRHALCIKRCKVHFYAYRNGVLKRAPKTEFYRGEPRKYHWGQHDSNRRFAKPFPAWMESIAKTLPEEVNHAIIIRYDHGMKTHAPWHSDKSEEKGRKTSCMKRGTSFFVISTGDPRVFQLGDETKVAWEAALPDCSMIQVTAKMNQKYKHCVPQDPDWQGCRWSLIFRTIV